VEYKDGKFWQELYEETYLPYQLFVQSGVDNLDKKLVLKKLETIFVHEGIGMKICEIKKWKPEDLKDKCESCTLEFNDDDVVREEFYCHANICKACCTQWVQSKVKSDDIMPFLRCPGEECTYAVPFDKLSAYPLTVREWYELVNLFAEKLLQRNPNWIFCTNGKCRYGVLLRISESEKDFTCDNCGTECKVKRKNEFDEGFKEMLKQGKIRFCPKCKYPHMKDYGLCNVMQCGKCKMWWNWKTYEMAPTERELKNKARVEKTLWEPGELEYQQKLERENPMAFKALLESNGIKYDPKYVRGHG
jgi:hypothetical protein